MPERVSFLSTVQMRIAKAVAQLERLEQPPFVHSLVQKLGYAAESSITPTLKIMQRKGFLEILGGGNQRAYRVIRLTSKTRVLLGMGGVPLLGSIPAGPLSESMAQADDIVEVNDLLKSKAGDFLLRVKGDSMTGDGIFNGDLVLLRPQVDLQQGEIAAVYAGVDYDSTLKHVFVERERVRLIASNPAYKEITIPLPEWRGIAGVFRGLVRNVHR